MAIDINDTRSLHAAQLVRDALRNMSLPIASAEVLILGASYHEDVGVTYYSGSEILIRRLTEMGAEIFGYTTPMLTPGLNLEARKMIREASPSSFVTRKTERLKGAKGSEQGHEKH